MAITTLEGMISGLQNPIDFVRGLTGTMVAGRPVDLSLVPIAQQANWSTCYAIYRSYIGSPNTEIHIGLSIPVGFDVGQEISVAGYGAVEMAGLHTVVSCDSATGVVTVSTPSTTYVGNNGCISCREKGSPGYGGINGAAMTSYPAQIPFQNPASGNTYLARLQAQSSTNGTLLLCDRLWFTCGITPFMAHTEAFSNVERIPARDMNGTNNGHGVLAAIVVMGTPYASGTSVGAATLSYTNQSGDIGKTASMIIPATAAPPTGTFYPMDLAPGDTGIRQVESLTVSTQFCDMFNWGDTAHLGVVLYRVLARLPLGANTRAAIDALTGAFPRLFDDTVPFLVFIPAATTSSYITGHVQYAQG